MSGDVPRYQRERQRGRIETLLALLVLICLSLNVITVMNSIITIIITIIIMNIINVGIEIFILTVNTINNSNTRQDLDAGTLLDCGWGSPYLPAPPTQVKWKQQFRRSSPIDVSACCIYPMAGEKCR